MRLGPVSDPFTPHPLSQSFLLHVTTVKVLTSVLCLHLNSLGEGGVFSLKAASLEQTLEAEVP